jgi:hypothetical protein
VGEVVERISSGSFLSVNRCEEERTLIGVLPSSLEMDIPSERNSPMLLSLFLFIVLRRPRA